MKNNTILNSGISPNHIASGAAVSLLAAGTINAMAVRKGEITKYQAASEVIKRTTQGTIATASVVAATNYKNQKNGAFKALASLAVGAAGVYAVELLDKKLKQKEEHSLILEEELTQEVVSNEQ